MPRLRPQKYNPLSPETAKRALFLKEHGFKDKPIDWQQVARIMRMPFFQLLQHFDPERLALERGIRRGKPDRRNKRSYTKHPFCRAPAKVLEERNQAYAFDLTPNHVILGDPPPSRSALGQRQ